MVKIELGKAYVDSCGLVICVHSHDPKAYGSSASDFRDHVYAAMCLGSGESFVLFHSTYTTRGQFDRKPGPRDVVREATLEELEYALSRHKLRLTGPDADEIVSKFYEAWKKHNPRDHNYFGRGL